MVKCGVLFEVRTGFLNIIKMNSGFRGLKENGRNEETKDLKVEKGGEIKN
jgi:Na+/alanine symporter